MYRKASYLMGKSMVQGVHQWTTGFWIGLRENLNRKPMGFYHQIGWAFLLKFSHRPILWWLVVLTILKNMKVSWGYYSQYMENLFGFVIPSGYVNSLLLKMAIEIVGLPIENGGSFHSYVKLPEGNLSPLIFSPYRPLWSQICVDKNPTKSMVFAVFCSTGRENMED